MIIKKVKRFKTHKAIGFFDEDIRLSKLSKLGGPTRKLAKGIDFEIFRDLLEEKLLIDAKCKGQRPFNYVLMFKILILQLFVVLVLTGQRRTLG